MAGVPRPPRAWSAAREFAQVSGDHKPACEGLPQSPSGESRVSQGNSFTKSSHHFINIKPSRAPCAVQGSSAQRAPHQSRSDIDLRGETELVWNRENLKCRNILHCRICGSSEKGKVVTAAEAVRLIRDGDTVATGGFVGIGFAEEHRGGAGGAVPVGRGRAAAQRRQAAQSDAGLCGRPGRRQGARAQPSRPRGPGQARDRRPLGPGAEAAAARHRQPDRSLQPAAGRDHPPVPRHRRRHSPATSRKVGLGTFVDPRYGGGSSTSAPPRTWSS